MRSATWRLLVVVVVMAHGCVPITAPTPAVESRARLRRVIDSLLAAPETRHARWGVLIVDPERGDTLYSRDAGKLLVPASNQKIITSAVALDALGPDFRFHTIILAAGDVRDSTLVGDLRIAGRGDPSVSDRIAGDAMLPLLAMADSLRERGIRRVRGDLRPHDDAYPDANVGWAWEYDDLRTSSGAAIDELLFNEGISTVHVRGANAPQQMPQVWTTPARTFPPVRVEAITVVRGSGGGGAVTHCHSSRSCTTPRPVRSWSRAPCRRGTRWH